MTGEDGESNDEEGKEQGGSTLKHKVLGMGLEPNTHIGQLGNEEIVDEIDVEGADTDILQGVADACLLGEPRSVVAEESHDDQHQCVHRHRARQVGPLHTQVMPLQVVAGTKEGDSDEQGEEPLAVEEALNLTPVPMNEIAKEEELEISRQLRDARDLPEGFSVPREPRGHIQRGISEDSEKPEDYQGVVDPLAAFDTLEDKTNSIIHQEHLQEHHREPVAALGGTHPRLFHLGPEVLGSDGDVGGHEDNGRNYLNSQLFGDELSRFAKVPGERGFICQETADKEEQRHAEQQAQRHEHRVFGVRVEAEAVSVVCHHHEHRKATQGVKPFKTLFIYHRFLAY